MGTETRGDENYIYRRNFALILYGTPVWKSVLKRHCYKAKLIRIQRLINLKIAKAYRTVSNEALCIINGVTPINIKIEEIGKLYEITERGGTNYDKEMGKRKLEPPGISCYNNRNERRQTT